jgi:hypothetical protein
MLAALPPETDLSDASDEDLRYIDRLWDALTVIDLEWRPIRSYRRRAPSLGERPFR